MLVVSEAVKSDLINNLRYHLGSGVSPIGMTPARMHDALAPQSVCAALVVRVRDALDDLGMPGSDDEEPFFKLRWRNRR